MAEPQLPFLAGRRDLDATGVNLSFDDVLATETTGTEHDSGAVGQAMAIPFFVELIANERQNSHAVKLITFFV